jgi:proteasome activator subunit 4
MSVDGPVRQDAAPTPHSKEGHFEAQQTGFLEGSKALDSLDRLITSTESFFHPSNSGQWTLSVSKINSVIKMHSV